MPLAIPLNGNATNNFGVARFIVDPTPGQGTHTTISNALAQAVSGQDIFIRPGTYTENPVLVAGVNLSAWNCDAQTPNVTINGNVTFSTAGTVSISGINFQTNSNFAISITGSSASILNLIDCNINCSNNIGINYNSSNASSQMNILRCTGNLGTTGITFIVSTSAGNLLMEYTHITNTGNSSTDSSVSTGVFNIFYCSLNVVFTTSSVGTVNFRKCILFTSAVNTTVFTTAGTGTSVIDVCDIASGTASAISIGAGTTVDMNNATVSSSNTNAITGSGSLFLGEIVFTGTSSTINTSSVTPLIVEIGTLNLNTALTVANGGTGRATLTNHGVLVGAATTAITQLSVGASNTVLAGSTGADPSFTATPNVTSISFGGGSSLSIFSQGTFSPTVIGSSTAGTVTMGTQVGRYQKVGRIVTVTIVCSWTTIGGATGAVECNNLPFAVINDANASVAPSLVIPTASLVTASGAVPYMAPGANSTNANVNYYLGSAGSNAGTTITASNSLSVQLVYETV